MVWRNWAHCWMMRGHIERDWIRGCLGHYSLSQTPSWIQSQKWSVLHHIEPPRWAPLTHKIIRNNLLLFYATKFGKCSLYNSVTDTLPFKPFTSIEGETSTCNLKTTTTKNQNIYTMTMKLALLHQGIHAKFHYIRRLSDLLTFSTVLPWSMSLNRLQVQWFF